MLIILFALALELEKGIKIEDFWRNHASDWVKETQGNSRKPKERERKYLSCHMRDGHTDRDVRMVKIQEHSSSVPLRLLKLVQESAYHV